MISDAEIVREMVNRPDAWNFDGAGRLFAGVDLGTYKAIVVLVDEEGRPRAAVMRRAEVVQSGMILDFVGARDLLHGMMGELRAASPLPLELGATSFPPQTESANIHTTRYILESAGLEVLAVLDEPSAANLVLGLDEGAVVDVGGGTTGVAVIRDGQVVYSGDEATGGVHLSLVLAGGLRVSYEKAERIKADPGQAARVLPLVRPVIEKISSITAACLAEAGAVDRVCLVGGTCELAGFDQVMKSRLSAEVWRPEAAQMITPLGIARSAQAAWLETPAGSMAAAG